MVRHETEQLHHLLDKKGMVFAEWFCNNCIWATLEKKVSEASTSSKLWYLSHFAKAKMQLPCFIHHNRPLVRFKQGLGNLRPSGQMRPACGFNMARIRSFVTKDKTQSRVKTKLRTNQILRQ